MSIAGGYYKAVYEAARFGMDCVQIFTKNNNQWRAKPMTDEDGEKFRSAIEETGIRKPCAHSSYLINLASPKDDLWRRSVESFVEEILRADKLGLSGVVIHPGSYVESSPEEGLKKIVVGLKEVLQRTEASPVEIWLETTAGQGSNLGWQFEELQFLIEETATASERLGVCIDTCHIFAAGYAIVERKDYLATVRHLDRTVGLKRVRAFHLNDSLKVQGSRVDRHAHIGQGEMGLEPFRHVLNDKRFAKLPMYLETPKGFKGKKEWDAINLQALRKTIRTARNRKKT